MFHIALNSAALQFNFLYQDFAMSDFSLTLVLQIKTSKIFNDMAKVSIKSEKNTPFGQIFHVREKFSPFCGHL